MSIKTIPIPSWIVDSGDDTHYYNLVYASAVGSISREDNSINVSDITISNLKSVLSEDNYKLTSLLNSSNINTNSYYRSNKSSPHGMSEMAGYNHYAVAPTYFSEGAAWESIVCNISADGENWKISVPAMALRRGETLPPSGLVASWDDIKVTGDLYPLIGESGGHSLYGDTSVGRSVKTGIDVIQMRNNTAVPAMEFPVENDTSTYGLVVIGNYTVSTTDSFPGFTVDISAYKFYPYSLYTNTAVWLVPEPDGSTWAVNVYNIAPDTGNSQSYNNNFKVCLQGETTETDPFTVYGYSENVEIDPSTYETVISTFTTNIDEMWDTGAAYTLTIWYDAGIDNWTLLGTKDYNM